MPVDKNTLRVGGKYRALIGTEKTQVVLLQALPNGYRVVDLSDGDIMEVEHSVFLEEEVFAPKKVVEGEVDLPIKSVVLPGKVVNQTPAAPGGLAARLKQKQAEAVVKEKQAAVSNNGAGDTHGVIKGLAGCAKTTSLIGGMQTMKGDTPSNAKGEPITPSPQQEIIWDFMKRGKANSVRFCAFGNAIAAELQYRLDSTGLSKKGCEASTFHKLGYKAVIKAFKYMEPNRDRVKEIISQLFQKDIRELRKERGSLLGATDHLVSLCKVNLLDGTPDDLDQLTSHFDIEMEDRDRSEIYNLVPAVLEKCKNPVGTISFDDMIYLPNVHNLPLWKSDMLLVDERQDLNKAQQMLAYKAGHRIIGVGDINQAIFGFAGADAEACQNMDDYLRSTPRGLTEMALTVTRRCGKAIVEEARKIVPEFEAHPDNPEGEIKEAMYPLQKVAGKLTEVPWSKSYCSQVRNGDFILCRCNAPLVSNCFRFLKEGLKANILGRNIGEGLINLVKNMKASNVADLVGKVSDWLARECEKEEAKRFPSESKLIALNDKAACVIAFSEGCDTIDKIIEKINQIFTDTKGSGIILSSIHKAKGLEADRVFLLQPEGAEVCPSWIKKAWERVQSRNLLYVATTRPKLVLTYVY